jgi:hypothetical protein
MGAFASMARNNYGYTILGWVAIIFGCVFLYQFIQKFRKRERDDWSRLAEPLSLTVLSIIFALRIFQVHFPFVELLFLAAGIALILIYLRKMQINYRRYLVENKNLARLLLVFYASIVFFLISLVFTPFIPRVAEYTGILGFFLMIFFLLTAIFGKNFLVGGEKLSAFNVILGFRDRSVILFSLFFILSLYTGFNRIGVLPKLYTDEYPQAYFELVNQAESGKKLSVGGEPGHEMFKQKYEQFLERNIGQRP